MHSEHEVLIQFLADVDEQIRYRPMHAAVNEELKAHIEDKAETYMEYGMEEEEAFRRAVREMGDASAIGIQMNEAHHLRTAKPLLVLLFVLMGIGIRGNPAACHSGGSQFLLFRGRLHPSGDSCAPSVLPGSFLLYGGKRVFEGGEKTGICRCFPGSSGFGRDLGST